MCSFSNWVIKSTFLPALRFFAIRSARKLHGDNRENLPTGYVSLSLFCLSQRRQSVGNQLQLLVRPQRGTKSACPYVTLSQCHKVVSQWRQELYHTVWRASSWQFVRRIYSKRLSEPSLGNIQIFKGASSATKSGHLSIVWYINLFPFTMINEFT